MGVRFPGSGNNAIVNATLVTTAETVIATSTLLNPALDFQQLLIFWYYYWTPGVGIANSTMRLRRGTTVGGTLINVAAITANTAGVTVSISGLYVDTPGAVAEQQYSVTLQQTAATGNGTVNDVCIAVLGI